MCYAAASPSRALLSLSLYGDVKQVSHLIVAGETSVHTSDSSNNTLLHMAAKSGSVSTVHALITLNANVQAVNCEGKTAFQVAQDSDFQQVVALLKDNGGWFPSAP